MTIEIKKPELENLIEERLKSGAFRDVEALLTKALYALREKSEPDIAPKRPKRLIDVLTAPPFAGSELKIERLRDYPRPVHL